ncbi:OsmC family protein [Thaumasiovibrio sp. DFM-14]|uniref:OsmC family protein n=1 Tax=Thaumasiovibrio sp. DFM-14 TaxID=3384792 RepID=UPI0039A3DA14
MQSRVKWVEGMTFLGQSDSGHSVVMDGNGGEKAPSPMELVLMAAGGCSSVDVVDGLKSAGQLVSGCEATLSSARRDVAPRYFTAVNVHFIVIGHQIDSSIVERVVAESLEKYCSVCLMLGKGVEMTHSYEVIEA